MLKYLAKQIMEVLLFGVASLVNFDQKVAAAKVSPSEEQVRAMLLLLGFSVLIFGLSVEGMTQEFTTTNCNDHRCSRPLNSVLTYLVGSFGALLMVGAGAGCILAALAKRYSAALILLLLAVGAIIARLFIPAYFNDQGIGE